MNDSSLQKDMPISRNGSYEGGNGHSHTFTSAAAAAAAAQVPPMDIPLQASRKDESLQESGEVQGMPQKPCSRYWWNATDGCGEFIPGGEEGSLEALKCSACNCHRNFHRKEMTTNSGHHNGFIGSPPQGYPASSFISSRAPPPHQVVVSYKNGGANAITSESDEKEEDNGGGLLTIDQLRSLKEV
uniref:ZF-HD dimerization-type domain-containing protein n=1 Tax=Salix viminalis TaxID=40686 RepID=A0A6N2MR78_SALVM